MTIKCNRCENGTWRGDATCDGCGETITLEKLVEFERLDFLLREVKKRKWIPILQPDGLLKIEQNYLQPWKRAGLTSGMLSVTEPETLKIKYQVTSYILRILPGLPRDPQLEHIKQLMHNLTSLENRVQAIEYQFLSQPLPELPADIPAETEIFLVQKALQFLDYLVAEGKLKPFAAQQLTSFFNYQLNEIQRNQQAEQEEIAVALPVQTPEVMSEAPVATGIVTAEPVITPAVAYIETPLPRRPRFEFKWEKIWSGLLSENTLRALLYIGALLVVVSAIIFSTLNWQTFPPLVQASMIVGADLVAYGTGTGVLLWMKLRRAGLTFIAIGSAILPLAIYGFSRPGLLDLNGRETWTLISLVALPLYYLTLYFIKERLFSYLATLATLNALWAVLFQFGLEPEWLAVASIAFAAGAVWFDSLLKTNQKMTELAGAPFWVGQALTLLAGMAVLSYYIALRVGGSNPESVQWALGVTWWAVFVFYGVCSWRNREYRTVYLYGTTLSAAFATYLTMQKLEFMNGYYGPVLGALGLLYLAIQNLPELVERLNDNLNITPWEVRKVLNLNRPLNLTGWLLLAGSLLLSQTNDTLAINLVLLVIVMACGALLYNWRWLGYLAVSIGATGYALLALKYVAVEQGTWALLAAALTGFGLWLLVRRTQRVRFGYFRRPLEYLGHTALLGALAFSGIRAALLYPVNWETAISYCWPVVAVAYGLLALVYRKRWWVDAALGLLLATALILTSDWSVTLIGVGWLLALVGLALREFNRPLFGTSLAQWGYSATLAGLALSANGNRFDLLLTGTLCILLSLLSALLAFLGRAPYLPEYRLEPARHLTHILAGIWLYPALILGPLCLWQSGLVPQNHFGLVLVALALVYFGLILLLVRYYSGEKAGFNLKELTPPWTLGVGWLLTGLIGLSLICQGRYGDPNFSFQPWYSWGAAAPFALTCGYAAFRFKQPLFSWLLAALLWWMGGFGLMVDPWNTTTYLIIGAVLATGFALAGYRLPERFGLPFQLSTHGVGLISLVVLAVNYLSRAFASSRYNIAENLIYEVPLVIMAGLYLILSLTVLPRLYSVAGLWLTLVVGYLGLFGDRTQGGSQAQITTWGFIVLAALASFARPYLLVTTKNFKEHTGLLGWLDFDRQYPFLTLSHLWAILALTIALYNLSFLVAALVGLVVLYLFRSWYEKRASLLVPVAGLVVADLYFVFRRFSLDFDYLGPAYLGLAVSFCLIARLYHHFSSQHKPFDYKLAYRIFSYSGQILVPVSLAVALRNSWIELATLVTATFVAVWLAKVERAEWSYGALLFGLVAYSLGYSLAGWPDNGFGLALFVPALAIVAVALGLKRYGGPRFSRLPDQFYIAAGFLVLIGLPQSWQADRLMLIHTALLTIAGAVVLRLRQGVVWLVAVILPAGYAICLGCSLIGVRAGDFGLALIGLAIIYQVVLLYFHYRATWLKTEDRRWAVLSLTVVSQSVALVGLGFSWNSDWCLTLQLLALTGLSLVNLATGRNPLWRYTVPGFGQLAYLAGLSYLVSGGAGLSLAQVAYALLPISLIMAGLACIIGQRTGANLAALESGAVELPGSWQQLVAQMSLPYYLAAGIDILISLGCSLTESVTGLAVAGVISVAITTWALLEQNRRLAWFTLVPLALTGVSGFIAVGMALSVQAVVVVALAFGSHCLYYLINNRPRLLIYRHPTLFAATGLVITGAILWLGGLVFKGTDRLLLDTLSWLLAITGLNYLLVSLMEQRRLNYRIAYVRYLGYAAVVLIDVAFCLRLVYGSVTQLQFYILPVGLGCLIFSWLERRHENRRVAHLLESTGLVLLLGSSLLQAFGLQTEALDRNWYGFWLLFESILALIWGAANHLKYYFFGGVVCSLLSIGALLIDPARIADKWVMLGVSGLILIGMALFLERKREMVVRLSRSLFYQIKQWQ